MTTSEENRMTRTPAPALSPAEAARVAAFDAAPTPPEVVVETVARALWITQGRHPEDWGTSELTTFRKTQDELRRLAAAAIAADPSPAEEAVKRVEALAAEFRRDGLADSVPGKSRSDQVRAGTLLIAADRIRAALASPAPAPEPAKEAVRCGRGYTDAEHWIDGYYACPGFASPAPAPQGEEGQR